MNYYISDLHIGCTNKFDNRTLDDDNKLIENWNRVVHNNDTVYILGDIGKLGGKNTDYVCSILSQLKGKRVLVIGNHDRKELKDNRVRQLFTEICDYKVVNDNFNGINANLVLSHYPILFWENQHKGWIHLYGHVHISNEWYLYNECLNNINEYFLYKELNGYTDCPQAKAYNVGAMLYNYTPQTLKDIINKNTKERELDV